MKRCKDCKETKPLESFYKSKILRDGCDTYCTECRKKRTYMHRAKNLQAVKIKDRERGYQPKRCYGRYIGRAKKRKIEFSLSFEQFMSFWNQKCHYCGDILHTGGIDRKNNNLGYVLENCVPCCGVCNLMKKQMSEEQWFSQMMKILKYKNIL